MECVNSVHYTLLVNGSLTKSFKPARSLRQGDPLSPYIFLLCANVLSIAILQAEHTNLIKEVKIGRYGSTFTHLLFADDSLLFFKKDNKSLENLQKTLDWYCSLSRQYINLANLDIYCSPNMPLEDQESLARSLHVNLVPKPSKYLCLYVKLRGNSVVDFQFLVEKLNAKLLKGGRQHCYPKNAYLNNIILGFGEASLNKKTLSLEKGDGGLTGAVNNKLNWKHSSTSEFNVKTDYKLLSEDFYLSTQSLSRSVPNQEGFWNKIWKVKVPQRICNFVWRLMHDSLPTMLILKNRSIPVQSNCHLCDADEESTSHLFMQCPFARACWHGSTLAIHSSDFRNISVQQLVKGLLSRYNFMDDEAMGYLQGIFTTLWAIWKHKNLVIHEGKIPNPMEVVLITQNLSCRYKEAYTSIPVNSRQCRRPTLEPTSDARQCPLIIKIEGVRRKKARRSAYALEANNVQGDIMFWGLLAARQKQLIGPHWKLLWRLLSKPISMVSNAF
ncbi:uncharacterized protein LOC142632818 [Castanea sativa]|uniref:uncharacterized protein LOC142632818 n=1 Tax=Castanea sativa TaxID=21020 RepID=UPI003F64C163